MLSFLQKMINHLLQSRVLQIHVLQIRVLQIRVLQIHVLQIRVLQIRVLQIQSMFYKSNPVHVLQHAIIVLCAKVPRKAKGSSSCWNN